VFEFFFFNFQTLPSVMCKHSVKSVIDVYLQLVFEALIIVANYRHIRWVCEYSGQSEVFRIPLNSAQCLMFQISVPKSLLFDNSTIGFIL